MRKVLVIVLLLLILVAVNIIGYIWGRVDYIDYADQEMYDIAYEKYQEHIFELAIDSTLFMPVVIEDYNDSLRSYRWAAVTPDGDTVGLEVSVAKSREIEPKLIQFGKPEEMILLDNTKHSKKEWTKK